MRATCFGTRKASNTAWASFRWELAAAWSPRACAREARSTWVRPTSKRAPTAVRARRASSRWRLASVQCPSAWAIRPRIDGFLVGEEEVHDLLASAQEVEGLRLANGEIQATAVALLDGEPLGVPERLLEGRDGIPVGVHVRRLVGESGEIFHGLRGIVGLRVVGRQAIVGLVETIRIQGLKGPSRGFMKGLAPSGQEARIRDLLCEGVPEGVLEIGEEPALAEELRGLEGVLRPRRSAWSASSAIAWRRAKGTSLPITAAACSSRLSSGARRSMRAARIDLAVAGIWRLWAAFASR